MSDVNNNPEIANTANVPPLTASVEAAPAPVEQMLSKCDAGYVLNEDNVIVGELTKDGTGYEKSSFAGEMALLCDTNWQSSIPRRYRLSGIPMSRDEVQCLRKAWGFGRDGADKEALALDKDKAPGTWCIEKMPPSEYKMYFEDEQFAGFRECFKTQGGEIDDDRIDALEAKLVVEEEGILEKYIVELGVTVLIVGVLAFGIGAPLGNDIYARHIRPRLFKDKGPKDPPPTGGGGGGELPAVSKAPVPTGAASASKMSMADKAGLIGLGIMGAVLMYLAGPAAMSMGLQGSAAGGAGVVGPGLMGGGDENYGFGPMA